MLVVISDIHLCDGTATPRNVSADAFSLLYGDLHQLAVQYRAQSIDLVLLGDVIDLLRTERWFEDGAGRDVAASLRPWGSEAAVDNSGNAPETLAHARLIADEILAENEDALRSLRRDGEEFPKPPCPVRRIYLPGNHDRLYLQDEQIRANVRAALGAEDERTLEAEGVQQHALIMPRYGLIARHGHEWDIWNFGRYHEHAVPGDYSPADYLYTPIGDAITTELVARLPFELRRRLAETSAFRDTPELDAVYRRMQRIEDVRPLIASFRWAFYQGSSLHSSLVAPQAGALRRELQDTVRSLAADFKALPYYRAWRRTFHKPWHLDSAGKLELVLDLLEHFDLDRVAWFVEQFSGLVSRAEGDDVCLAGAAREELRAVGSNGLRFVVYGHTHEPLQMPLHRESVQDVYLNSGTWRQRQFFATDRSGFVSWDLLTYLVFLDARETPDGSDRGNPAFLSWNGTRRVEPVPVVRSDVLPRAFPQV